MPPRPARSLGAHLEHSKITGLLPMRSIAPLILVRPLYSSRDHQGELSAFNIKRLHEQPSAAWPYLPLQQFDVDSLQGRMLGQHLSGSGKRTACELHGTIFPTTTFTILHQLLLSPVGQMNQQCSHHFHAASAAAVTCGPGEAAKPTPP